MVDTEVWLETVREMGKVLVELMEFDFEPATIDCPIEEKGPEALKEDDRYGPALDELVSILGQFGEVEIDEELWDDDEPHLDLRAHRSVDGTNIATLHVPYVANGSTVFVGELYLEDGTVHPIDHHPEDIEKVDIGRFVARAELAILSADLESAAEALDYWAIESSGFGKSDFRQSSWAEARGISRQGVSNNIGSAKDKFSNQI